MNICQVLGLDDRSLAMFGKSLQGLQVTCLGMVGEDDVAVSPRLIFLEFQNESGIPQVVSAGPWRVFFHPRQFADFGNTELLGQPVRSQSESD